MQQLVKLRQILNSCKINPYLAMFVFPHLPVKWIILVVSFRLQRFQIEGLLQSDNLFSRLISLLMFQGIW